MGVFGFYIKIYYICNIIKYLENMPRFKCTNTSCKHNKEEGFIRKVIYRFDEDTQELVLKTNECPECKAPIDIMTEKDAFRTVKVLNKRRIKANPPRPGQKFYY